jgi:uncharacterized membrane protein
MTKVMVASFKDEAKAMDALHKLNELESFGDISIYDKIMVRKKKNGDYETLKEDSSEGWRALGGMAIGGLLGTLGGPLGFIIGLYAGVAIGAIAEINHFDFAEDFIKKVENKMAAGTVSIIAEIDEEDNDFIDISLNPFGAAILKSNLDFAYDNYMNEQIEEIEDEISEQRAELKKAIGKDKEKIEKKITALKEKRKEKMAEFDAEVKKSAKNIKTTMVTGVDKVKTGVKKIADSISGSVKENKADRIKNRIVRHEAKLINLKNELKGVTD